MRFSILIVNYNGGAYLQSALNSLKRQTLRDFEVLLVDNASRDGSVDALDTSGLAAFTLLAESRNHGFAAGNNLAAARATGDWLVLLNPDAEAAPDWLERIAGAIRRHRDTTMFACLQRDLHDPGRLDGAGDGYFVAGVPWRGAFGHSAAAVPHEGTCFSPCGASAVYRADIFHRHGGFDERFFCFCEDIDLAFRLRASGETCRFLPEAVIHHAGGGVSGRVSDFALYYGTRNRLWLYIKNMPGWTLWASAPAHAALSALILARGLTNGRFSSTWRGLVAGWRGRAGMLADRKRLAGMRTVTPSRLLAAMCFNPWRFLTRHHDVRRDRSVVRDKHGPIQPTRRDR